MSARAREIGRNGALFREVNNYIVEMSRDLADAEELEVLCECERLGCVETIPLSLEAYRAAREREVTFVVAPGHQSAEADRVVRETETYVLVEKTSA